MKTFWQTGEQANSDVISMTTTAVESLRYEMLQALGRPVELTTELSQN